MAQTLKPALRDAILDAARDAFAVDGWSSASLADIARRAGVSTGNVYRYFANRDALYAEAIPDAVAEELLRRVERRVSSLARTAELTQPDPQAVQDAEEMLAYLLAHRREAITLLSATTGPHAAFPRRFAGLLEGPILAAANPTDPVVTLLVGVVVANTVHALAAILRASPPWITTT